MDAKQYAQYKTDVAAHLEGLTGISTGICPGCQVCADEYTDGDLRALEAGWECGDIFEEPWFSWRRCNCCGSTLGGNRETMHAVDPDGNILHVGGVCVDCVYFLEYGCLDDTTMAEIEAS